MKEKIKNHIIELCITAFLVLISIAFIVTLSISDVLPANLLLAVCVALVLLVAITVLLVINRKNRVRFIIGCILCVIITAVLSVGIFYVGHGALTLHKISTPETELAYVGIYVKTDNTAQTIDDTKNYTFGILSTLDRDATDKAINAINKELKTEITLKEYSDIGTLCDALLLNNEINAIILNESFLELLSDTEGYEDYPDLLRKVYSTQVTVAHSDTPILSPKENTDCFTVYISGIDSYGSLSRRSRSDVNILATVNKKTGQILLVSTPRDYYVPLSISNGVKDKLTHAGIYGINVSRDTLAMLYDTEIDYYFKVNFDGFPKIIDALGGITINSEVAFSIGEYKFVKGENTVNGEHALVFARERYLVAGGDRQRGKNQMAVIKGVIDKITGPALITNYKPILDSISNSFETDMPYSEITNLIQAQLKNGTKWNVTSYAVDGSGSSQRTYSSSLRSYVMIPNEETVNKAKALMKAVENGEVPTP